MNLSSAPRTFRERCPCALRDLRLGREEGAQRRLQVPPLRRGEERGAALPAALVHLEEDGGTHLMEGGSKSEQNLFQIPRAVARVSSRNFCTILL